LGLRAVVFDYGMVLTGPPDPKAYAALRRITGLSAERLDGLYWADRHAYDEGKLTGLEFWQKLVRQLELKQRGLLTAILSNMGDNVHANMEREFDWLARFDVLVWSYQLRMAKPDPTIYRYVLKELGTQPGETLFIDDKPVNIEAAHALGMRALLFTTAEKLRADLVAQGFESELPLPA
jgi:putative hydrolase of the HAD superfamily